MLEIIKSLTGKQKFIAVLIITLITSTSSILTMYFKTDDCKGISDQYTALVKNQMELMSINNKLLSQYNVAKRDLKTVNSLVDNMDSVAGIVKKDVKIKSNELVEDNLIVSVDDNLIINRDSSISHMFATDEPKKVKTKKIQRNEVVVKTPIEIKNYIDSINKITSKY